MTEVIDREALVRRRDELMEGHEELQRIERLLEAWDAPKPRASKRRNRQDGETRAQQFVSLVEETPGITVARAAPAMDVNPNYLYRLANDLVTEGLIRKDEESKGYFPASEKEDTTTE